MTQGESRTITIPASQAYGPHRPERIIQIDRNQMPSELPLEIGSRLQGNTPEGQRASFTVVAVTGAQVTLDGSASSDPDGDPISFEWRDAAGNLVGTTALVRVVLLPGRYRFTLTVMDSKGATNTDGVLITVRDRRPFEPGASLGPRSEAAHSAMDQVLSAIAKALEAVSNQLL